MLKKTRRPGYAHPTSQKIGLGFASVALLAGLGCASGSEAVKDDGTSAAKSATTEKPANAEAHFRGTSQAMSPDGATMFGPPTPVLVKRTLMPAEGVIVEDVHHGKDHHFTTLVRQGETGVFEASDDAAGFTGTVTFAGDPYAPGSWTYDITMGDGSGRLTGEGSLSDAGIKTTKTFASPDGVARARIVDDLAPIDAATYASALGEIEAAAAAE